MFSFNRINNINGATKDEYCFLFWFIFPFLVLFTVFPNVIAIASRQELPRRTQFFYTMSCINNMKRPLVLQLFGARGIFRPRIVLSFNRISDIKSIYGSFKPLNGRYPLCKSEKKFFPPFFYFWLICGLF